MCLDCDYIQSRRRILKVIWNDDCPLLSLYFIAIAGVVTGALGTIIIIINYHNNRCDCFSIFIADLKIRYSLDYADYPIIPPYDVSLVVS